MSVSLTKDQAIFGAADYAVLDGGEFDPTALVLVYRVVEPAQIVAFPAQFCYDGTSYEEPEELAE